MTYFSLPSLDLNKSPLRWCVYYKLDGQIRGADVPTLMFLYARSSINKICGRILK